MKRFFAILFGIVGGMVSGFLFENAWIGHYSLTSTILLTTVIVLGSIAEIVLSFQRPRHWYHENILKPFCNRAIRAVQFMGSFVRRVVERWFLARIPATSFQGRLLRLPLRLNAWITQLDVRAIEWMRDYFVEKYYVAPGPWAIFARALLISAGSGFVIGIIAA